MARPKKEKVKLAENQVFPIQCQICKKTRSAKYQANWAIKRGINSGNCKKCSNAFRTHGKSRTKIYQIWLAMRQRCYHLTNKQYKYYGGRGIKVCDKWKKFENFFADMGERPEGLSLDRIDNNGNYCPENCRWATRKEQSRNTGRNIRITLNGKTKVLKDWAKDTGINYYTLRGRLRKGWSIHELFLEPQRKFSNQL